MYFFFHLLAGTILGLLIGDVFRDERWVIPCAIGSVLPDLIDKPLDLVVFSRSLGNGYIYGHSLAAVAALGIAGLLILWIWRNPVILAISAGILSHQLLDLMWRHPQNWLYPAFGPFTRPAESSDILVLLARELNNPLEIILFACLCVIIGIFLVRHRVTGILTHHFRGVRILLAGGVFGLLILAGIFIGHSRGVHTFPYLAWNRPEDFMLGAIVTALAAMLCWRWYHRLPDWNSRR